MASLSSLQRPINYIEQPTTLTNENNINGLPTVRNPSYFFSNFVPNCGDGGEGESIHRRHVCENKDLSGRVHS
jgi:hypothetical protein